MEIRGLYCFLSLYSVLLIVVIFLGYVMTEPSRCTEWFTLKWLSYEVFTALQMCVLEEIKYSWLTLPFYILGEI